jgi:hypothetical protein
LENCGGYIEELGERFEASIEEDEDDEEGDKDDNTDHTHQTDGGLVPPLAGHFGRPDWSRIGLLYPTRS